MNTRSGHPRGKPLPKPPSPFLGDALSVDLNPPLSLLSPFSQSSSSASAFSSAYVSSPSTITPSGESSSTDQEQFEPRPSTPPKAKPSPFASNSRAKLLAQELKSTEVDPVFLLLSQMMEKLSVATPSPPQPVYAPINASDSLAKSIGSLEQGEDIFVFLHRFEYGMKFNTVPAHAWLHILPKLLHGTFKEASFNSITETTSYQRMRTVLLNSGGYSLSDCLASFPLKFRSNGSKSVMQFFNNWRYKYGVMLSQLSFLDCFTEDQLDLISQGVAALGLMAGMSNENRKAVLDTHHDSPQSFVEDCASSVASADDGFRNHHSGNYFPSRPNYHSQFSRGVNYRHSSNYNHSNSFHEPYSNYSSSSSTYLTTPILSLNIKLIITLPPPFPGVISQMFNAISARHLVITPIDAPLLIMLLINHLNPNLKSPLLLSLLIHLPHNQNLRPQQPNASLPPTSSYTVGKVDAPTDSQHPTCCLYH